MLWIISGFLLTRAIGGKPEPLITGFTGFSGANLQPEGLTPQGRGGIRLDSHGWGGGSALRDAGSHEAAADPPGQGGHRGVLGWTYTDFT